MNQLTIAPKHVPSIPAALRALDVMERELDSSKTYEAIRKVIQTAEALKILLGEIDEVKQRAETVILIGNVRIGEEIEKVPKATGPHRKGDKKIPVEGNSKSGRAATGIKKNMRSRHKKLAAAGKKIVKDIAQELHATGKDATMAAVVTVLKEAEIKQQRKGYEDRADKGANSGDLKTMAAAGEKFSVIYADPPWEFKVYSDKGKKRSAERYYDTNSIAKICALAA